MENKNIKMKDKIEFSEFLEIEKKLEIKFGTIQKVERIEGSNKLLKMDVSFEEDSGNRTVVTNIGKDLSDDDILMKLEHHGFYFVTNLEPSKMMGVVSEAMILMPTWKDDMVLSSTIIGHKLL